MTYPLRILRAIASTHRDPRPLRPREAQLRAYILAAAADMLVHAGRQDVTFSLLAGALDVSLRTLRRAFACMDDLLYTLLSDYLNNLAIAVEAVPDSAPALFVARRRAYRAAIQEEAGRLHYLLLTQAATLPLDLQEELAGQRAALGEELAPGFGNFALMLLDDPDLPLDEAEEYLALKAARLRKPENPTPCQQAVPKPAREPEPAPPRRLMAHAAAGPIFLSSENPPAEYAHRSQLWASTALQPSGARAGPIG